MQPAPQLLPTCPKGALLTSSCPHSTEGPSGGTASRALPSPLHLPVAFAMSTALYLPAHPPHVPLLNVLCCHTSGLTPGPVESRHRKSAPASVALPGGRGSCQDSGMIQPVHSRARWQPPLPELSFLDLPSWSQSGAGSAPSPPCRVRGPGPPALLPSCPYLGPFCEVTCGRVFQATTGSRRGREARPASEETAFRVVTCPAGSRAQSS